MATAALQSYSRKSAPVKPGFKPGFKPRLQPGCLCTERLRPWFIQGKYLCLDPHVSRYSIPLSDLTTPHGWRDWHIHLQSKTWASCDVFEGLRVAAELLGGAA